MLGIIVFRLYIRIIGVPEEEERGKGPEKIFEEIIVENFPDLGKKILRKCRESYTGYTQGGINTPRHILIKLTKII